MLRDAHDFMREALELAQQAAELGEVPVAALIVHDGVVIARAHNLVEKNSDPTAHAEILAIREAARVTHSPRLSSCDIYVTLEPCPMCAQALSIARIRRIYYSAYDPKGGGVEHGARIFHQPSCHHQPEIYGGILEHEAQFLLQNFFSQRR